MMRTRSRAADLRQAFARDDVRADRQRGRRRETAQTEELIVTPGERAALAAGYKTFATIWQIVPHTNATPLVPSFRFDRLLIGTLHKDWLSAASANAVRHAAAKEQDDTGQVHHQAEDVQDDVQF